jgi:hypothetical protein
MYIPNTKEIAHYHKITEIVAKYKEFLKKHEEGSRLITEALNLVHDVTDQNIMYQGHIHGYRHEGWVRWAKQSVWSYLIKRTKIEEVMTAEGVQELKAQLKKIDDLPELTEENIFNMLKNVYSSAPDKVTEFIKETFEWLLPIRWENEYKTNQKFTHELKEKVIKTLIFKDWYGSGNDLSHDSAKHIMAMDNAFRLLDGKGVTKWPNDFVTKIFEAIKQDVREAENDYFHFKWYKNGNAHITFKRLDLLSKINAIASGGFTLKNTDLHQNKN